MEIIFDFWEWNKPKRQELVFVNQLECLKWLVHGVDAGFTTIPTFESINLEIGCFS